MEKCIEDKNELKKFVEENISQSNYSTRLTDAHKNINPTYKVIDANEELLKVRYLKGNSPNKLLDKKENNQGKIYYTEGQLPKQEFNKTKSSLKFSQELNIKDIQEE